MDVYLDNERNIVQPDLIVIKTENLHIIKKKGIVGSPDIVFEILSSNKEYDINMKFQLYQKNQISEYIIISPDNKDVLHYILTDGKYIQQASGQGTISLKALNTEISF